MLVVRSIRYSAVIIQAEQSSRLYTRRSSPQPTSFIKDSPSEITCLYYFRIMKTCPVTIFHQYTHCMLCLATHHPKVIFFVINQSAHAYITICPRFIRYSTFQRTVMHTIPVYELPIFKFVNPFSCRCSKMMSNVFRILHNTVYIIVSMFGLFTDAFFLKTVPGIIFKGHNGSGPVKSVGYMSSSGNQQSFSGKIHIIRIVPYRTIRSNVFGHFSFERNIVVLREEFRGIIRHFLPVLNIQ